MDGIKEALQYAVDLAKPNIEYFGDDAFTDKRLTRIDKELRASSIQMTTLTSLVDYIRAEIDGSTNKMLVHVKSPTKVSLISQLDDDRERETLVEVDADIPTFPFGRFINHEEFCITLQSKFIDAGDRGLILKFAGTVEDGTVAQYGDDGVTQKATVKTGISSKSEAIIPNPVSLVPYRTFQEIDQVESNFIFRMKSDRTIECALFEADGGAWKNETTKRIKDYLKAELASFPKFTVIS